VLALIVLASIGLAKIASIERPISDLYMRRYCGGRFRITTELLTFSLAVTRVIVQLQRSEWAVHGADLAADLMKRSGMAGFAIALFTLIGAAMPAGAEIFPSRPVTMMVGFPPGGPTDTLARIVADAMQGPLGQPVVVETLSGASGTIATGRVVHARPDGYTIGIGQWSSHVASPAIYPLDYDILRDLQPISLLAASPLWIIGKEALPPNTVPELIAWMKARPEPTSFGTVGTGSAAHLCGLYFAQKTGSHLQYVPYRGAAPAMQDVIGGQIDLSCLEASSGLAYVQAAKFKAFAVFSEQRWPKSPETPTMIESGIPGATIKFWHALWTTKGTPKESVDRLHAAVMGALATPAVQQRLETIGQVMFPRDQQGPAALAAYHRAEIDKWWPIIKAAGIKAD
jgi:tripartite-type tricarboxylate transporter receptor subunit TctC